MATIFKEKGDGFHSHQEDNNPGSDSYEKLRVEEIGDYFTVDNRLTVCLFLSKDIRTWIIIAY